MRNIVFLIAGDACNGEALGVIITVFAIAVDDIVNHALITSVEDIHVEQVFSEESLVLDFCNAVFTGLLYDNHLRKVGAIANIFGIVIPLEPDSHEAFFQIGGKLGVVIHHLGGGNGLKIREFCKPRVSAAVSFFKMLEPIYGELGNLINIFLSFHHLGLESENFLVIGLCVEFGNLPYRFFHQFMDVFHHDFALEEVLILLHLLENVLQLLFPTLLILLQHLVDAIFKEDFFQ